MCTLHVNVSFYRVTYTFQRESTLYNCLNFKELLVRNKRNIWSLNDCKETRTHNHLLRKWTLNHLAKLIKSLSLVVSANLYLPFDCIILSCHIRVSERIHTLWLPQCEGTPCSKHGLYLKFKWLQGDSNPQRLCSETNTQPFG